MSYPSLARGVVFFLSRLPFPRHHRRLLPFAGAYNFEDSGSSVGNNFMNAIQPFAATHPVAPVEGNHVRELSRRARGKRTKLT
jgi:hypothetical protein